MNLSPKGTLFSRIRRRACFVLGVFSKVRFWFLLVLAVYLFLTSYHFLNLQYTQRIWWDDFYNVSSAFLIGGLVSFLFYFLVVFIPERKKRRIIKSNLKAFYAGVKRDILYQVILASQKGGRTDLSADSETIEQLLTTEGFKAAFKDGREGYEGFYAFRNYIGDDVPEYREIVLKLQMLSKQIDFVLHNYSITNENIFSFFKRLELFLLRIEKIGPGYEEEKVLSSLILEMFWGFDLLEGDRGYDIIEKMIEGI